MFINCPYCRALVATDLATDLPPIRCPQCQGSLRETEAADGDGDTRIAGAQILGTQIHGAAEDTAFANTQSDAFHETAMDEGFDEGKTEKSKVEEGKVGDSAINGTTAQTTETEDAVALSTEIDDATDMSDSALVSIDADASLTQDLEHENTIVVAQASRRVPLRRRAGQVTPSFARTHANSTDSSRSLTWPAIAAIVGLSGLFVLQMLLADRARLATNTRWRPLLETLCGALPCDLPPWREPAAFAVLQRDVRQHPTVPGALRVSASFRNEARWPQPWPRLHLTLSDVNGRTAGERRFEAREYLGGAPAQPVLASGETATVAMDILEPAAQIVAYDFRFD